MTIRNTKIGAAKRVKAISEVKFTLKRPKTAKIAAMKRADFVKPKAILTLYTIGEG